ncbi:MAG TPA: Spy/CpxP family protein refolding chaperone [Gemmatimonadales bacterium]|nr:Spy/CpxP family protein refolding chaperone [Gemmatimonadales bacterium]
MRTILTVLATAFALVATTPPTSRAQGPSGRGPGAGLDTTGLGLTADQQAKWKVIRDDLMKKNAPLREQARQVMGGKSFRDLTPEERETLRPKLQPIMDQMRENARKAREQAGAILTPEQKQKFEARIRERMEMGGEPPH